MTTSTSRTRSRKTKIFRSVFQVDVSQPTPALASVRPGEPFGGPTAHLSSLALLDTHRGQLTRNSHELSPPPPPPQPLPPVSDQVRWDRAWHVVTSHMLLPSSASAEDSFGSAPSQLQGLDATFYDSLAIVLNPQRRLPRATHTEDILQWHTQQVRQHFSQHVLPLLAACASQDAPAQVLVGSIQTLEAAHRLYSHGVSLIVRVLDDEALAAEIVARFKRDLHATVGSSWTPELVKSLRHVLGSWLRQVLIPSDNGAGETPEGEGNGARASQSRDLLLGLVESLHQAGLAGERFQVLFAELLDTCMETYISKKYGGVWAYNDAESTPVASGSLRAGCVGDLSDWVENEYGRLAVEVLSRIGGKVAWSDVERWKEAAIGRLATLRIHELFDIVQQWPKSRGGVEDLKLAVTAPQSRLQLTDTFSTTLQKRLLHPGRSTLYILQTYIAMIRTFHALDHTKVLLDRVVHTLQLYLCQRDDAIRVVVTGLLSSPTAMDREEGQGKLVELAVILSEASQQKRRFAEEDELDWNDMTWLPDPVDAGVNYKRPKNEDVIGTLINALGSQDIFIKEFQLIVAERLLSNQPSFTQETKVLKLLKKRFGDSALQNCDVMLKDIQDSKRVDSVLGKTLPVGEGHPPFHSKILSRLFWPSLPREPFAVPPGIAAIRDQYAVGFEHLKSTRKLKWLDQLGSASVQLELEDRVLEIDCKTYEASVIHAFHSEGGSGDAEPARRTFNQLWENLMLDEDLLTEALAFWVSKRVLRDVGDQTYIVLERLDPVDEADQTTDPARGHGSADVEQVSPRKPKGGDPAEKERRIVYWQFIVGMLTNSSSAMPLGQILMTLKMLIPGGCPWSNEELQEFLGKKVAEAALELVGGKYRLPKK